MLNNTRELGIHPKKKIRKADFFQEIYLSMSVFQIKKSSGITPVAFFQIQVEFGGHLGFMKISNFRLIHTKCHVIPHFWIFWG